MISGGCSVPGCSNRHEARGWCTQHYRRWRAHGDPLGGGPSKGECRQFIYDVLATSSDECVIWPYGRLSDGRAQVNIKGFSRNAARVVCILAHGDPPTNIHEAAHSCGRGYDACVNPKHLRWATPAENAADRVIHGTELRGEKCSHAKLKEADVFEIRRRLARGDTQRMIANDYAVGQPTINMIATRKTWAWLQDPK